MFSPLTLALCWLALPLNLKDLLEGTLVGT